MRVKNTFGLIMALALVLVSLGQAGLVAQAAPAATVAAAPSVLTTVTNVGATPTGVAVDPVHNYIYVAALGGSHLTRINGNDWSKVYSATTGVVYKPMGLAVDPTTQLVYATNTTNYLSIVNGYTMGLVQAVNVGSGNAPMDVVLEPNLGYAFASDFNHSYAFAINMNTYVKTNIANVAPGGTKMALSADGKIAYVSCYSSNSVDVLDTARQELVARYFGHFSLPVGIAVNPLNNYIYVANSGNSTVAVVDDRNDLQASISVVGSGSVKGVAYNPNTNHLFVTRNGTPGQVHIYSGTSPYNYISTLTLQNNPDAYMAMDTTRNLIYVTNQASNSVSVIQDTVTAASAAPPEATPPTEDEPGVVPPPDEPAPMTCPYLYTNTLVSTGPNGIAIDDTNKKAYVANGTASTVSRIDLDTNLVEGTSPVSAVAGPTAIAVNPLTQKVYVANGSSTSVSVLDGPSLSAIKFISPMQKPRYIYLVPEASAYRAWVANYSDDLALNYITEIDTFTDTKIRDIAVGRGPYAVVLSADRQIAYVACYESSAYSGSYLSIVDISQGKEVGQYFTHYNKPTDIVMDPSRDRMYVANEGGFGAVVAVDHRNLLKNSLDLGGKPRGLALNPTFNRLAVVQKDASYVSFIDLTSYSVACGQIFTLGVDRWIAFSALYNRYYAPLSGGTSVTVIQDYVGDGYENDDSYTMAKVILNDIVQVHSIDPGANVTLGRPADQDWVKFQVSQPMTLTFVTTDTYPAIYTTMLSLYDTNGTTLLTSGDNHIDDYAFTTTGTYYLKITATNPAVGAANYTYQLRFTGGLPSYQLFLPLVLRQEAD
ncbi:MAG: YncE family protein [Chloroflexi bacterium]|nr:YncE family protein [Chloroflexota bacterium]MBU1748691.1 YncE family protein [Chloroflexota bacterium]